MSIVQVVHVPTGQVVHQRYVADLTNHLVRNVFWTIFIAEVEAAEKTGLPRSELSGFWGRPDYS